MTHWVRYEIIISKLDKFFRIGYEPGRHNQDILENDMNSTTPNPQGAAIRAFRTKLGMTLKDVSEKTGLSISTVSKLEKGNVSLSYEKLVAVSNAFGVPISELLGTMSNAPATPAGALFAPPARAPGRRVVQRLGEGVVVPSKLYDQLFLGTDFLNPQIIPILAEVKARSIEEFNTEFGGLIKHPGEEFALVLEGDVEFHSEFYAPVLLKKGESVYFDSSMGHAYVAASLGRCQVLSVCTATESVAALKLVTQRKA